MIIKKIKKISGSKYKITLDDNRDIITYEDVIINNNLLPTKSIDNIQLEKINKDNIYANGYDMALRYINIRLRSIKELNIYLAQKGIEQEVINNTVNLLQNQGYLNDIHFAKAFMNDKMLMTNWGPLKIKRELENLGIKVSDDIHAMFAKTVIAEKIKKMIDKMLKTNKTYTGVMLKKKLLNNLLVLGFEKQDIIDCLDEISLKDDKNLYEKEYNKLYQKYKNKYPEDKVKQIIRQRLYQKGFTSNNFD